MRRTALSTLLAGLAFSAFSASASAAEPTRPTHASAPQGAAARPTHQGTPSNGARPAQSAQTRPSPAPQQRPPQPGSATRPNAPAANARPAQPVRPPQQGSSSAASARPAHQGGASAHRPPQQSGRPPQHVGNGRPPQHVGRPPAYRPPVHQPAPPHVGVPGYGPVHVTRPPVYYPPVVVHRPLFQPIYTRPTIIVQTSRPQYVYSRYEADRVRTDIRNVQRDIDEARRASSRFRSLTDGHLRDASSAVRDAENLHRYGYPLRDVQAALQDAQGYIRYAYDELRFAEESLESYRAHAASQLEEAEYFARDQYYNSRVQNDLRDARRAFDRAESAYRSSNRGDEALRGYEEAARLADRVMENIHDLSYPVFGQSYAQEYEALVEWQRDLETYATYRTDRNVRAHLDRAARELRSARDAMNRNRASDVRKALDHATKALESAHKAMERWG